MFKNNTDESWKTLGNTNPYYGVLTFDKFRNKNLDDDARVEFFQTGQEYMVDLLNRVEKRFGKIPRGRALDFGCGVGRLTLPLVVDGTFSHAVGMDISESMLTEARKNADKLGMFNLDFVISDDFLSQLKENFDFIHSYITLQHIPVKRGEMIIKQLISRLSPGGLAALHMPFVRNVSVLRKVANFIRVHIRILHVLGNILQGRPWSEPPMQMNRYNLNSILRILHESGVTNITLELIVDGSTIGGYLLVQKPT